METNLILASGKYFGTIASLQEAGGIQLCETRYTARQIIPDHSHELPFFCYVLTGTFSETRDNRTMDYQPGAVIFHPPGDLHSDRFHDIPSRCFNVEFSPRMFSEISLTAHPWNSHGLEPSFIAMRMFREFRRPDHLSRLAIEGLSMELMASGLREFRDTKVPKWLQLVKEELHEHFAQNFSFKGLALNAGVHPVHLARSFRKFYGTTVAEYVRNLRIEHARNALVKTQLSISEIALASGFCDQSHFTKIFKRFTGVTPSEFRKLYGTL